MISMVAIINDNENAYRFSLKSESGRAIFNSQTFSNKDQLKWVLYKMMSTLATEFKIERVTNHSGKFFFIVKTNGNVEIGRSNLYDSEAGLQNGIENMKISLNSVSEFADL